MRRNESLFRSPAKLQFITMQEMADELGVSRQTYKIEENPAIATVLQARRICAVFESQLRESFSVEMLVN